ncbi:ATP-binding protein [Streptomyces sp. NPDC059894]|uniref:ATP-binding protein n=1 Tax=unclassified Streptomyces TaxID=2593676 RepID=UPI00364A4615
MTMHIADQGRTCRRAAADAADTSRCEGVRTALEVFIERRSPSDSGKLSAADAAWPKRLRRIIRASLTYWGLPQLIDVAELLLTELATNALRHGRSTEIGVRVYLAGHHCVIEVAGGSPDRPEVRRAGPSDEGGRGLFLVAAMAEAWGVSPDGSTTWCTVPLTEGPAEMQPAAT